MHSRAATDVRAYNHRSAPNSACENQELAGVSRTLVQRGTRIPFMIRDK